MSQVKNIGVLSAVKLLGFLYLLIGFLIGAVISLIAVLGGALMDEAGAIGLLFGGLAIVIFPIFYGVVGAIGGAIGALLYNLAALVTGGIELELE